MRSLAGGEFKVVGNGQPASLQSNFLGGHVLSLVLHLSAALWFIFGGGNLSSGIIQPPEIYTVTIEGGDRIGGISQVPLDDKKAKVLPNIQEPLPVQKNVQQLPKVETKPIEQPSVVEEQNKKAEEQKKQEEKREQERKIQEQKLMEKKLEEKKLREQLEKAEKEKEQEERKKKEREKKERDKRLEQAISRATNYTGESANAGGQGLGAARLGGKGMGGGTPASIEFIMYRNALEQHIKSGWRWLPSAEHYKAQIDFTILPDGTVQNARISASSGSSSFDESALRAVYKASPVPVPPRDLYEQFRQARMTFDSEQ